MNQLAETCCLCLNKSNSNLFELYSNENKDHSTSYFDKISESLSQLAQMITDLYIDCLVCCTCSNTIEMIHKFNQTCLDNVQTYAKYHEEIKEKTASNELVIISEDHWVHEKIENISDVVDFCQIEMEIEETENKVEDETNIVSVDSNKSLLMTDINETKANKEKLLKNSIGKKPFKKKINPDDLIGTKSGMNLFTCNICGQSYKQRCNLTTHMHIHTQEGLIKKNKKKRSFLCHKCGKAFNQKIHLLNHNMTHTGEKPHACDICGKRFRFANGLYYHKLVHINERSFACDQCDKTFRCKRDLQHHGHVHTDDRKHVCEVCNSAFKQKGDLISHIRRHTGERPYACSICDKKFITQSKVAFHKRTTHASVKPYACNSCDKSFIRNKELSEHKTIHTGQKNYLCDLCYKSFHKEQSLKRHKKSHNLVMK